MNDFKKAMDGKSDRELIQIIVSERHKFTEDALVIAQEVLDKRELSPELISQITEELNSKSETESTSFQTQKHSRFKKFGFPKAGVKNDSLDAQLHPTEAYINVTTKEFTPRDDKIINIILFFIGTLLLFKAYNAQYNYNYLSQIDSLSIMGEVFLLLGVFLGILFRNKLGWEALFFYGTFWITTTFIFTCYYHIQTFFEVQGIMRSFYFRSILINILVSLAYISIYFIVLRYFWKPRIKRRYGIDDTIDRRGIMIGLGLGLAYFIIYLSLLQPDINSGFLK